MPSIDRRHGAWFGIVAVTTTLLVLLRTHLDKSHFVLAYLIVVLIGTSRIGRRGGIVLAFVCFFCFNFFLLPPFHAFVVQDSRDWLVLLAFLVAAVIAAQLLHRAQHQTAIAEQRSEEVARLSRLGAETLSAGRAEDAVAAVVRVMQSTLNLGSCEIYLPEGPRVFRLLAEAVHEDHGPMPEPISAALFEYVMSHGVIAVQRTEGSIHVLQSVADSAETAFTQRDAQAVIIPLVVRDQAVGLLRMSDPNGVSFDDDQRRFAETLAWYAALSVERVRLTAEAEHAAALAASNRVKNEFIAAVSHDLRTPLTAIRGLAHELGGVDERARVIEGEADRLNHMVADLLELSRFNAGALELRPEVNTVEDLIGAMLNQLSGLSRHSDLRVGMPEGGVILARFDFVHSLRVLVNLVDNALKYSAAGSPIDIVVERRDDNVGIAVSDRGPGIEVESVERLFEPFVRLPANGHTGGAGLGLTIAHRIAVAQGGAIRFEPRPGGGSIFTFLMPTAAIDLHDPAAPAVLTTP